ncbi:MAG: hypothetical protein GXZ09_09435 [Syntrophomonadaceae bacterium]|nr:hypothetical protein [Syntrophomonadaceae bacterium]
MTRRGFIEVFGGCPPVPTTVRKPLKAGSNACHKGAFSGVWFGRKLGFAALFVEQTKIMT